jgi:hypothetical protein
MGSRDHTENHSAGFGFYFKGKKLSLKNIKQGYYMMLLIFFNNIWIAVALGREGAQKSGKRT